MQSTPVSQRETVDLFDREFTSLIDSLRTLTKSVPAELLYRRPPSITIGENILKSAGVVEQTFGGITTSLWDDPFEWTLPETLSTPEHILEYLLEVETTKSRAFRSFVDDKTLLKYIALPSGNPCRLLELLVRTLIAAAGYRGQAGATLKMLSDVSAPGFII
jgi:hypothetical protein